MATKGVFKRKKGVVRGRSAAFLITVGVHIALIVGAGLITAMVVIDKQQTTFEGKQIKRPKMKLKKLQVPVKTKKIRQPKLSMTVAPPKPVKMDLAMPAMTGLSGGMNAIAGAGGGSIGFGMDFDPFGLDDSSGNELVGTFYDLKQKPNRMPVPGMNEDRYAATLREFVDGSWDTDILEEFFQAPKKKFAISLMIPVMTASAAPQAFDVEKEVRPSYWVVHYKGEIVAPESGRFRFVGMGDDVLIVRAKRKVVLDACWPVITGLQPRGPGASSATYASSSRRIADWTSDAEETGRFPLANRVAHYGDWIKMRKGETIEVEVLIGESPGGEFSCSLLVEQDGQDYRKVNVPAGTCGGAGGGFRYPGGSREVLPVFKMVQIPDGLKSQMKIDSNQATFEGPSFGTRQ